MDIHIRRTTAPRSRPQSDPGFGRWFSDHMFRMEWTEEKGWHEPTIRPYGPLSIDPAAAVLHYAQTVFEGLKAFRGSDDAIRLFRPDRHAARMNNSCSAICMPELPEGVFVEAVKKLVEVDRVWVPRTDGASLYIRPLMIATEPFLGVRPAKRYDFVIMTCPVGAYYAEGFAPVKIRIERERVRAAHGGLGACKTGANYAASLRSGVEAKHDGYAQVLWTDAAEHRYVEEVGTMNLFVKIGGEVITPALDGAILPGVTRDSVIRLLKDRGISVHERRVTVDEIQAAHADGSLEEVFGTGTAAVVSPVSALGIDGEDLTIGNGGVGPMAQLLFDEIVAIQRGNAPDRFDWTVTI